MADLWNSLVDGMGTVLAAIYSVVPSYGVAIIGLTVLVRLLLFPLTAKQARSMQKMQIVQPEVKKLQARYKDDRQKLNEEIMKFYRENKINPLAGCLPLVAQMPIFFALFRVLIRPLRHIPEDSNLYQDCVAIAENECQLRFLGMDLSQAASRAHESFVDALPYFILIGFVVLTGYLQFKQTQSRQSGQVNPQMAMIGKIFPIMFAFISFTLPAGVVLYFLVSNTWQIGQQALIFGSILPKAPPPLIRPVEDSKDKDPKDKDPKDRDAKGRDPTGRDPKGGDQAKPPPGSGKQPSGPNGAGKPTREGPPPAAKKGGSKGSGGGSPPRDGHGRAQPSGSRPRPKKRRR